MGVVNEPGEHSKPVRKELEETFRVCPGLRLLGLPYQRALTRAEVDESPIASCELRTSGWRAPTRSSAGLPAMRRTSCAPR